MERQGEPPLPTPKAKHPRVRRSLLALLAVSALLTAWMVHFAQPPAPISVQNPPGVVSIRGSDRDHNRQAKATGFMIARDRVITNWHVIAFLESAVVITSSGQEFPVTGVIASDEKADIAILAVPLPVDAEHFLSPATTPVRTGDAATIIPDPRHAHSHPLTVPIKALTVLGSSGEMILLDCDVHHGWSGSPLVNNKRQVVGVLSGGFGGNAFAAPVDRVLRLQDRDPVPFETWAEQQNADTLDGLRSELLGSELSEAGSLEDALFCFERAATLRPDAWGPRYNVATTLKSLGRYEEAIEAIDRAAALLPGSVELLILRAVTNEKLRRYSDAAADLAHAIELDALIPGGRKKLASLYLKAKKPKEAADLYGRLIGIDPGDIGLKEGLADALFELGRPAEAEDQLRAVITSSPRDLWANEQLGYLLLAREQNAEAIPYLVNSTSIDPSRRRGHMLLAKARYRLKRYSEATTAVRRALQLDPEYVDAWFILGRIHYEQERWHEAVEAFEAADRWSPGESATLQNLVDCLQRAGRTHDAIDKARQFVVACPKETASYYWLADSLESSARHAEALATIAEGLAVAGDDSSLFLLRGDIYDNQDQPRPAIESCQASLRVDPSRTIALEKLIRLHVKIGEISEARRELARLETADPEAARRVRDFVPSY